MSTALMILLLVGFFVLVVVLDYVGVVAYHRIMKTDKVITFKDQLTRSVIWAVVYIVIILALEI